MKRLFDFFASFVGLVVLSPILLLFIFLICSYDKSSPFYIAPRVGLNGVPFRMAKLRSMTVGADKTGVDSTGDNDVRITPVGKLIRKLKVDELLQLWNVLIGDMSLVGPRPNVLRETLMYTPVESNLLTVKPGITDFASIVFADEGKILRDSPDPDLSYHQLIRPGKSALGLFYIEHSSFLLDLLILNITLLSFFSRSLALRINTFTLRFLGAPPHLLEVASRLTRLQPTPPPGSSSVVTSRDCVSPGS
jgi:lipopolysaccharide/colanic/teichoic acid biosynthesis glycosyltransferase